MILVDWYQIDWFVWLPIILVLLLTVILFLRILRRRMRWGPVEVSHVQEDVLIFNNLKFPLYRKTLPIEKTEPKSIDTKSLQDNVVLLFPPISIQGEKQNHLAIAIALMNYDVIVISTNHLSKWLSNPSNKNDFAELIGKIENKHCIIFDYAMNPIVSLSKFIDPIILKQISWLFLRPTLNIDDTKHIWQLFPFSGRWWAKIQFYFQVQLKKKSFPIDDEVFHNLNGSKTTLIQPCWNWLSENGKKNLNKWMLSLDQFNEKFNFNLTSSTWSFHRQETIVIGLIAQHFARSTINEESEG